MCLQPFLSTGSRSSLVDDVPTSPFPRRCIHNIRIGFKRTHQNQTDRMSADKICRLQKPLTDPTAKPEKQTRTAASQAVLISFLSSAHSHHPLGLRELRHHRRLTIFKSSQL